MSTERLKKELQNNKPTFGFEKTMKNIKIGKTKIVFAARNCPEEFKRMIRLYSV